MMAAQAGRGRRGIARLFGFGLSMIVLAVVTFAAIPAMVAADGAVAWGAIALGQSIGTIGAVLVNYGWPLSGPVAISGGNATIRRRVYGDSIRVRLLLFLPVAVVAAAVAVAIAPGKPLFAAAGAMSATAAGLTGMWYFVGVARPYAFLVLETLPRAAGTLLGVGFMKAGFNAIVGLVCVTGGSFLAFLVVSVWVYFSTGRDGAVHRPARPLGELMRSQRVGLVSMIGSNLYTATPIVIFSLLAPATQPNFALANKIQLQLTIGLSPAVYLMQGWVPKGVGVGRIRRADASIVIVFLFSCAPALIFAFLGAKLFSWLGGGEISFTSVTIVLVAIAVVANLIDAVLRYAVLPSFDRLDVVARATVASAVVGLPLVAVGVVCADVVGALTGVIAGIILRILVEAVAYFRSRGGSAPRSLSEMNPL